MRAALLIAAAVLSISVQAQEPLRIGFLTVRTGPLAAGGRQMEEGINLFLKERGNELAGRKPVRLLGVGAHALKVAEPPSP